MVVVVVVTTLSDTSLVEKIIQEAEAHVVVVSEGARCRTGRWPDAIVADDEEEPWTCLELDEGAGTRE